MPAKEKRIKELETEMQAPDFWRNYEKSGRAAQELGLLKEELEKWQKISREMEELFGQVEPAIIAQKLVDLKKIIDQEEIKIFLGGQYDNHNAILTIYSGAGGTEAQDWAEMLLRMYLRFAEHRGFKAQVLYLTEGQETGLKNVTLEIKGRYAYGYLRGEAGAHRLVRLSPFSSANLRHTSFALVEVLPEIEETPELKIKSEDLRVDTYRASGPGGQYVNKTESAVRLTHLPTGLVVACQNERSQGSNKEKAMKLLYTKLYQLKIRKQEEERVRLRDQMKKGKGTAEWGTQIRSYVLHPYKLVKDLRTGIESKNPEAVLDGELDDFIEAEIRTL